MKYSLPEGWKEVTLGEIVDILGDGLHGTPKYDNEGEYFFINGRNLKGDILIDDNTKRVNYEQYVKYKKDLNDRTIFLSINGTIGNMAYYNNEKIILGKSACYLNVMKDVSKDFIKYTLMDKNFKNYSLNYSTGTTIKNLGLKQIRDFPFYIPPIKEQKAIANILSKIDDKIENNIKINKTLEEIAQQLFKHWFVDFEFPNDDGEPYKSSGGEMVESEMGRIPKGWEVVEINRICERIRPGTNYQPKRIDEGIPFLNVRNINKGYIDCSDAKFISKNDYKKVHSSWVPEENDVLISRIGTLGLVAVISEKDLPIAVHYNFIDMKAKEISHQLLYFILKSDFFQQQYHRIKKASVQEYVTINEVKELKIFLPMANKLSLNVEKTFNALFNKIDELQLENQNLSNLRDLLLPKLMSGEIRVPLESEEDII